MLPFSSAGPMVRDTGGHHWPNPDPRPTPRLIIALTPVLPGPNPRPGPHPTPSLIPVLPCPDPRTTPGLIPILVLPPV